MTIVELFNHWGGHIMSIVGIIGGIIMYFRHDKKLKEQEKRLNDFQLKQFQKNEEEEKKANVACNIIKHDKGKREIRIFNTGKSVAKNVRVYIEDAENMEGIYFLSYPWGPYKQIIPTYDKKEETILLCMGCPDSITISLKWDDDFASDRENAQEVQL